MSWRERLRPELASLQGYRVERPDGLVLLDANESPWPPDDALRARFAEIVAGLELNRYPDPSVLQLRAAIAAHQGVAVEQVLVGTGSDELLTILLTAFAAAPASVAYPVPTFSMYGIHARVHGARTIELPTGEDFALDVDAAMGILRAERPSLLFIARPNNPTGTLWPRALVEAAVSLENVVTVVDEAYADFAGETCLDLVDEHPNLVVLRTLSKVGFAGLRVGWLVGAPELVHELDKVRLPYNLNALSDALAREVLSRWDELVAPTVERIVSERVRLREGLEALSVATFSSAANFLLVRVDDPEGIFEGLRDRGILVRMLHQPNAPLDGCLRVTVGTPDENDRLLGALGEVLP